MSPPSSNADVQAHDREIQDLLEVAGEAGQLLCESSRWAGSGLGPFGSWPQSLKTAVRLCVTGTFPMLVTWGSDFTMFYNDSYRVILGPRRHPKFFGQACAACWPDIWSVIAPLLDSVMTTGRSVWVEDMMLIMTRKDFFEEAYLTFSYCAIRVEDGGVGGVFVIVQETTKRILGERRLRALHDLSVAAHSFAEVVDLASKTLARHNHDFPFALIYLFDDDSEDITQARLVSPVDPTMDAAFCPRVVSFDYTKTSAENHDVWQLQQVLKTGAAQKVERLRDEMGRLPSPWPEGPDTAFVLPLDSTPNHRIFGFLILGISPRLDFDDDYRNFASLVAGHISRNLLSARAHQEERRRALMLEELDRTKTTFFSNVSHEFRTPLTLILGPLEELLNDPSQILSKDQRGRLELVMRNAMRLLKLVNTLLEFSRIESGRMRACYRSIPVVDFTAHVASVFRSAFEKAELELVISTPTDFDSSQIKAFVDPSMWEKIVLNLLSNALKFTFQGRVEVAMKQQDDEFVLAVRDSGIGIHEADIPHMFERFHRIEGAKGRTHEGTGIGLALTRDLVRLHHGTIEVESEVGVGTCFTVKIPLGRSHLPDDQVSEEPLDYASDVAPLFVEESLHWTTHLDDGDEAAVAAPRTEAQLVEAAQSARILLVDDNADVRSYITALLPKQWEVEAVANGVKAKQAIAVRVPDLILSDVMMPELDGLGLLKWLRNDEKLRSIPVILLSARAGEDAKIEGIDCGADDYLVKPFSAKELVARINTQLKLTHMRKEVIRQQQLVALRQEFLNICVHELRNPVTILKLQADIMTMQLAAGEASEVSMASLATMTERFSNELTHLTQMMDRILDISHIESAGFVGPMETLELGSLLEDAVSQFPNKNLVKCCTVDYDKAAQYPVKGNRLRLLQVISSLLSNAFKFSSGRPIHVAVRKAGANLAEISVRDDGIGISKGDQERIFELFQRAVDYRNFTGFGLGLYVARKIILAHGGHIRVASELGRGSTFFVELPLCASSEDRSERAMV